MTESTNKRLIIALIIVALCWLGSEGVRAQVLAYRSTWPAVENYKPLPPPNVAPIMAFGYREFAADLAWCSLTVYYGASRIGESDFRYLQQFIDVVIALDPKLRRVYRWAASAVTFQQGRGRPEEFRQAIKYLERGIEAFPDYYELYWRAGVHYWLDLAPDSDEQRRKYRERAADLIDTAMRKPDAPVQLKMLAASLRTTLGQKEQALRNLQELILTTTNNKAREAMLERFRLLYADLSDQIASSRAELWSPEKLASAKDSFDKAWQETLPYAPPALFVLIGEQRSGVYRFDELSYQDGLFMLEE